MSLEILFHQYWFYQAKYIWRIGLLLQNYQLTISLKYLTQDTQIKGLHTARFIISTTVQPQGGEVLIGLFLWITIIRILPLSLYSIIKNIIFYFFPFQLI
jgi:hypothetical protein